MAKRKETVHIHYVHHIHYYPVAQQAIMASPNAAIMAAPNAAIMAASGTGIMFAPMVHASMPGQPHTDIMTAPGFYNAAPDPAGDDAKDDKA